MVEIIESSSQERGIFGRRMLDLASVGFLVAFIGGESLTGMCFLVSIVGGE